MITPPNLREAIGKWLYVEFNADDEFARNLAAGHGIFDDALRRGLAHILATGQMDFDDFANVTDNQGMEDAEVLHRLRNIWDSAFPGTDPQHVVQNPGIA